MDLIYLTDGGRIEDLRYSLRSMSATQPHNEVWMVGQPPIDQFDMVGNIILEPGPCKYANTANSILAACLTSYTSDPFILMNDDFFCLSETAHLDWDRGYVTDFLMRNPRNFTARQGGLDALAFLKERGIRDPLCYELHLPMVVHKEPMIDAIQSLFDSGAKPWWKRTIYGNLAGLRTESRDDVKTESLPFPATDWVSTSDMSFDGAVGEEIKRMYPFACIYEKEA